METNDDSQDLSFEILTESARQAMLDSVDIHATYQFSEKDFFLILKSIWDDRFKEDLGDLKGTCAALLNREGINENQ